MPAITEDRVTACSLGTLSAFFGAAALKSKSDQDAAWIVGFGAATMLGVRWFLNKMTPVERMKQAEVMVGVAEEVRAKNGAAFPVKKTLVQNESSMAGREVSINESLVSGLLAEGISYRAQKLIYDAKKDGHLQNRRLESRISKLQIANAWSHNPLDREVSALMASEVESRTFWGFTPHFYKW